MTTKRQNAQTKHQAPSKGQPKSGVTPTSTAAMHAVGCVITRNKRQFMVELVLLFRVPCSVPFLAKPGLCCFFCVTLENAR